MGRYSRNTERGSKTNVLRLIGMAKGEYIKYLLDDDILHPLCLTQMVDAFQANEKASLVFSPRDVIDENNRITRRERHIPAEKLVQPVPGASLIKYCIVNIRNIIGEFSTVMFRRADVFDAEGRCIFFSYHGMPIFGLTDIANWLQLCERGDVVYLSEPLSYFSIHPDSHTGSQSSPAYRAANTDWAFGRAS